MNTLFLHGFMGLGDDYMHRPSLLLNTEGVFAPTLPGHSTTPIPLNLSWNTIADYIISILPISLAHPFHVYGYSMGARLALALLDRYPHRISSLTLESVNPGLLTELDQKKRYENDKAITQRLLTQGYSDFLREWYAADMWGPILQWDGYVNMISSRLAAHDPSQLSEILLRFSLATQPNYYPLLSSTTCDVTLVTGQCDLKFGDIARHICAANPRISHTEIEGQYHFPYATNAT